MLKKIKEWYTWYIKGEYHCEHCPYCWSEWSYEGTGDCGCYIRGDLRDSCRLIPPIRFLLGWGKKKKVSYFECHQYDGIGEYYSRQYEQRRILEKEISEMLAAYEILYHPESDDWIDENGKTQRGSGYSVNKEELIADKVSMIHLNYESEAHPYVHKKLSQEWKELLKKTFGRMLDPFRPYFSC